MDLEEWQANNQEQVQKVMRDMIWSGAAAVFGLLIVWGIASTARLLVEVFSIGSVMLSHLSHFSFLLFHRAR
jgi:hypothetical protein